MTAKKLANVKSSNNGHGQAPPVPPATDPPETDDFPVSPVVPPGEPLDARRPIDEIRAKFPAGTRVAVRRYLPETREFEALGSVPSEILDDDFMLAEFGPGKYELRVRREQANGAVIPAGAKFTVRIGARTSVQPKEPAAGLGTSFRPIEAATATHNAQIELLKSELDSQRAMMLRLIDSIAAGRQAAPPAATPVSELVAAMVQLQKLQPSAAPMSLPEKLMDKMFSILVAKPEAGEGDDNSLFGFAREVWKEVKPFILTLPTMPPAPVPPAAADPQQPNPPAPPAAIATPPEPLREVPPPAGDGEQFDETDVDITPLFIQVKAFCNAGQPAELVGATIAGQADKDPNLKAILEDLLANPLEEIRSWDPELQKEPYFGYFGKLYEVLRVRILGSSGDSSGAGGDGRNA